MELRDALGDVECLEQESMAKHTTFRLGGPVRWMVFPKNTAEAAAVLQICRERGLRPFFLGNGSNLLVADEGWDGVMVSTARLNAISLGGDPAVVIAGSGALLSQTANFAAEHALTGLEFVQGIPGSVGGGIRMNAGAYGGELVQVAERVTYLDETGALHTCPASECALTYRHSVFCDRPWLVTEVSFRLRPGNSADIRAKMADFARRRREKQPLEFPSAGSTFKRPAPVDGVPQYAAALIDRCGLRGLQIGGAQVSEKHAGFVVNTGNATTADVLVLMEEVRRRVLEQTGVNLEPEVEILR